MRTLIRVTDKYLIKVCGYYTVVEEKVSSKGKNEGQLIQVEQTYHHSLESALNEIYRRVVVEKLETEKLMKLDDVIEVLLNVKKEFVKSKINELDGEDNEV